MLSGYENRPPPARPTGNPSYGNQGKPMSPHPDYRQQQQQQQHQNFNQGPPRPHQQQFQSPPPGAYSSPPPGQYGQRPPPVSRPPPTPAPGPGVDPALFPLFKAVDKDGGYYPDLLYILEFFLRKSVCLFLGSGQLSEKELRAALVNGDWTSFDPHTVRMMIR